jgi:hypothetical protein
MAAIISEGLRLPNGCIKKSFSAFWKSESWCEATKRCLMSS